MELRLVKTLWGVEGITGERYLDAFREIKKEGYSAVEAIRLAYGPPNPNATEFLEAIKSAGLEFVAQIHTCGGYFREDGEYEYVSTTNVDSHIENLRTQAIEVKSLGATFANVHSGHDSWSVEEATRYFEAALIIEQEVGISLTHETHRQRVFNSPYTFHSIIKQPQLANLKINADLSHWVCLCEHVFDSKKFPERDVWWPEVLRLVAKHAAFIHARVGHQQGPQVSDPRAPEFDYLLKSHLSWWKEIISNQRSRGREICYLEPEFGPPPYMPTLPHSQNPVASLPEVVAYMKSVIIDIFQEATQ